MTVCKETEFAYPKWPHCGFQLWLQRVYLNTTSPKNDARRCPLYRPMGYLQSQLAWTETGKIWYFKDIKQEHGLKPKAQDCIVSLLKI